MLLFITGSFPESREGIAHSAGMLFDHMRKYNGGIRLLTTDTPVITGHLKKNRITGYSLMHDWHLKPANIRRLFSVLKDEDVTAVHMEYPGDLYGKTFLASFIPFLVHLYAKRRHTGITVNVRLHEFLRARFLRKLAVIPILLSADRIYVPSLKDRDAVRHFAKDRVFSTFIGSNMVRNGNSIPSAPKDTVISYFGSVYPGKGFERMLKIWQRLKAGENGNGYVFRVIGDIGTEEGNHFLDYHKKIRSLIKQYSLTDDIKITGFKSPSDVQGYIDKSSMAMLLFEDGLSLRRGSFLACLEYGIPVITTPGDHEAAALFTGHPGVAMCKDDEEILRKVRDYARLTEPERKMIYDDNTGLSQLFNWDNIAKGYLKDYGII
ncbi:MAG: glycosyltransferase [Lachnospiraceae bacterium]|nr:glycosyltransferase [Lachnospiraceae bacterium]